MYYLAIDLGAGSGRGIVYYINNGKIESVETSRFNGYDLNAEMWDINRINKNVEMAIKNSYDRGYPIDYIGIDTWGVDYGVIGDDGKVEEPFHYRNIRTVGIIEAFSKLEPISEQFKLSGIAPNEFNTLYQMYIGQKNNQFKNAKKAVFMPNLVGYYLTGKIATEPTIASTSGFYNKNSGYVKELLAKIGVDESLLPTVMPPHSILGSIKSEILSKLNINKDIKVVLTLGHDTAAAISAIPFEGENNLFLSSGTWSLFGTLLEDYNFSEDALTEGYTNEVGVGNVRFLKNIIGFWIIQQCIKKWESDGVTIIDFEDIAKKLKNEKPSKILIDVMNHTFLAPNDMIVAIDEYLIKTKQLPLYDVYQYANCIYTSLALEYRSAKEGLERISCKNFEKLYIFGGGSQNPIINQLTADSLQIKVLAGIKEASGLGNFLSQAIASGELDGYAEAYKLIKNTYSIKEYLPHKNEELDGLFKKYMLLKKRFI